MHKYDKTWVENGLMGFERSLGDTNQVNGGKNDKPEQKMVCIYIIFY